MPTATMDAAFPTAGTYSVTLNANQSAMGIIFAAGANVSIASSGSGSKTLTIGSDGIDESHGSAATTDSLSVKITLGATQTWNVAGGNALTVSGTVTGNAFPLTVAGAGSITVSGAISGSGGITAAGTGTLTLSGNNNFTGGLTIKSGTVVGKTNANAFGNGNITIGDGSGGSADATLCGGLAGTFANPIFVASTNTGVATITDSAASIFSGLVTLNNHDLTLTAAASKLTVSGGVTGTGNLMLNNNSATANGITLSGKSVNNAGTITNSGTGSGATLISAVIGTNVAGVVESSATSTLTLTGTNTYSGNTTISAGTISINSNSSLGNTTAGHSGSLVFAGGNLTLTANVTSPHNIIVNNTGSTINESARATLTSKGNLTINTGSAGALTLTNGLTLSANANPTFTLNGPTGTGLGNQMINVSAGNFRVSASNTIYLTNGGGVSAGTYELFRYAAGCLTAGSFANLTVPDGQLTGFTYSLSNNTANNEIDLVVVSTNILTWTGANDANDYNWDDANNWIVNSGTDTYPKAGDTANFNTPDTVNVDGPQAVGLINFNAGASITMNQTNSGTLSLGTGGITSATSNTISAPLVLGASITITVSSGSLLTISGNISDGGSGSGLLANGAGTLCLSGDNSFTGGTTVTSGTLLAANAAGMATGTGTVTVNTGATLGGTGTVGAIVDAGGTVSPGLSLVGT